MLYTHLDLHVPPGPDAKCVLPEWAPGSPCPEMWTVELARELATFGWCRVKGACSAELVSAARDYVAARRSEWELPRLRPDDWRLHLNQSLTAGSAVADGHGAVLSLLRESSTLSTLLRELGGGAHPSSVLYTQIASRTGPEPQPVGASPRCFNASASGVSVSRNARRVTRSLVERRSARPSSKRAKTSATCDALGSHDPPTSGPCLGTGRL